MSCQLGIEINPETGECDCPENHAILEKNITTNTYFNTKICELCPEGTFPGPTGPVYACEACSKGKVYDTNLNPWACTCNKTITIEAGDYCVPIQGSQLITSTYPPNIAKSLQFGNLENIDKGVDGVVTIANSDTFDQLYLKNGYECLQNINAKSCQVLANLCVLQMYDYESQACRLYNYINDLRPPVKTQQGNVE